MPSKTRKRQKSPSKDGSELREKLSLGVLENITWNDQNTTMMRTIFKAAEDGCPLYFPMVCRAVPALPVTLAVEAVEVLCKFLDVPAFPPEQPLPSSLATIRSLAYDALRGLSQVPDGVCKDKISQIHLILERHWKHICNWIQYFFHELDLHSASGSIEKRTTPDILTIFPGLANFLAHHDNMYNRLSVHDGVLVHLLIKTWLNLEVPPSGLHRHTSFCSCHNLLARCFTFINMYDPSTVRMAQVVEDVVREAQGNARSVARKLLQQIQNPAEAYNKCADLVASSLHIALFLMNARLPTNDYVNPILIKLHEGDLVRLLGRLFSFTTEDLAKPPSRRILSDADAEGHVQLMLNLSAQCMLTRNGQHWTALLVKLGFLRNVALLLPLIRKWEGREKTFRLLETILNSAIPKSMWHRVVITALAKAIKEITVSGDVTNLEASEVQVSWSKLTNLLLERTVISTAYGQYFSRHDSKACDHCSKVKQEASLFLCAGCKSATYCSKECQAASWKMDEGHRTSCKIKQEMWLTSGAGLSSGAQTFLVTLALTELRRHLPGVSKNLASFSNPSGVPLKDAFFGVSFITFPPTITVHSKTSPETVKCKNPPQSKRDPGTPDGIRREDLEVSFNWGGTKVTMEQPILRCVRLFAPVEGDGDELSDTRLLVRDAAQDEKKRSLSFVLDEVDRHVMNTRKNFRPPAPGDDKSPKTIYDYVEAKVAEDPMTMAWLGARFE
ncbi:hypothetical protein SCHPADRAFT_993766 [Schizopora paradoxa]|uniref:MYND-type domain-containing protein n=1 Tax=Schizopora paradoxa TaxID=27342 RepID=A0A0H2S296_9AGAM|nr:hypothetical protein SCHPADRAFT_993766 [Schizopora paradoxa]